MPHTTPNFEYTTVIQALKKRVYRRGINYSLDRLKEGLSQLGNPEKNLPKLIHVAGSNGKGSTVAYLASALRALGFNVGTYTSPHMTDYPERISTNGSPMSHNEFVTYFYKIDVLPDSDNFTEFEILTMMMCLYFRDSRPDWIVCEVGLGGRLDATNIVLPTVVAITKIDLEHQAILGHTLREIAMEKSGIIKREIPVFTLASQTPEALAAIQETAKTLNAPLTLVAPLSTIPKDNRMQGMYQRENLAIAQAILRTLVEKKILPNKPKLIQKGLANASIWGRFLVLKNSGQTIIVDGAHNPAGAVALRKSLELHFPGQKVTVLIGVLKTKELAPILETLTPVINQLFCCDFLPPESFTSTDFQAYSKIPVHNWEFTDPLPSSSLLLVTGSLYFLSKLRSLLPVFE